MRILALTLSCCVCLAAPAVLACGNSMREYRKPKVSNLVAEANSAFKAGQYAQAARLAEQALADRSSERSPALRTLGLASLKTGNFTKSIESFDQYLRDRNEPFVKVKLAEAQLRRAGAKSEVDAKGKEALELLAKNELLADADAWAALGKARSLSGDAAGAKKAWEEALKIEPDHAESKQLLASLDKPAPAPVKPPSEPTKAGTTKS